MVTGQREIFFHQWYVMMFVVATGLEESILDGNTRKLLLSIRRPLALRYSTCHDMSSSSGGELNRCVENQSSPKKGNVRHSHGTQPHIGHNRWLERGTRDHYTFTKKEPSSQHALHFICSFQKRQTTCSLLHMDSPS